RIFYSFFPIRYFYLRNSRHIRSSFHLLFNSVLSVKNCFIRGSVVRYVQLPADEVDTQLLQDAARKEALQQKQ
uniref:LSM2 homolog, U6 small nuclear RNA and mRNA degradation associated n=1 Tax=Chrysemys picta bellii TaxID=8478 RepID=A0A8C3HS00_CHRPI